MDDSGRPNAPGRWIRLRHSPNGDDEAVRVVATSEGGRLWWDDPHSRHGGGYVDEDPDGAWGGPDEPEARERAARKEAAGLTPIIGIEEELRLLQISVADAEDVLREANIPDPGGLPHGIRYLIDRVADLEREAAEHAAALASLASVLGWDAAPSPLNAPNLHQHAVGMRARAADAVGADLARSVSDGLESLIEDLGDLRRTLHGVDENLKAAKAEMFASWSTLSGLGVPIQNTEGTTLSVGIRRVFETVQKRADDAHTALTRAGVPNTGDLVQRIAVLARGAREWESWCRDLRGMTAAVPRLASTPPRKAASDAADARADVMDAVFALLAMQVEVESIPHGELAAFLDDASTTTAQAVSNLLRTLRDTQRALVALALRGAS